MSETMRRQAADLSAIEASRDEAVALLARAAEELFDELGEQPTASQVKLRMSSLSFGGFNVKQLGYSRFRDLVSECESRGLIRVDSSRAGDIGIVTRDRVAESRSFSPTVNPSVWRAVVDWSPNMLRVWDLQLRRAWLLPHQEVPLEPEKFKQLRARYASEGDSFLTIPHLSRTDQYDLFRAFLRQLDLEPEQSADVSEALSTDRPIRLSLELLRELRPESAVEWSNTLRARVQHLLHQWIAENPQVTLDDVFLPIQESAKGRSTSPRQNEPSTGSEESRLREAVHRAVDRMPASALRALSIPLGYLYGEE